MDRDFGSSSASSKEQRRGNHPAKDNDGGGMYIYIMIIYHSCFARLFCFSLPPVPSLQHMPLSMMASVEIKGGQASSSSAQSVKGVAVVRPKPTRHDIETGRDPDRVKIFDTTLRDGEQSPGCTMTAEVSYSRGAREREEWDDGPMPGWMDGCIYAYPVRPRMSVYIHSSHSHLFSLSLPSYTGKITSS